MRHIKVNLVWLFSGLVVAQNAHKDEFKVLPEWITPTNCSNIRAQKLNNEDHFLCLASSIVRNSMKSFEPIKSKCKPKLNLKLAREGVECYSVKAWHSGKRGKDNHKFKQSSKVTYYYSTGTQEFVDDSVKRLVLTLDKELSCKPVYRKIKQEGDSYGKGASVTIIDTTLDSDHTTYGMGISVSYGTPLSGIIGGVTYGVSTDRSRADTTITGKQNSATFKGTKTPCEPMEYHVALLCERQSGFLRLYSQDGTVRELPLKKQSAEHSLLMPLNEMATEYFTSISGCLTHTKTKKNFQPRSTQARKKDQRMAHNE